VFSQLVPKFTVKTVFLRVVVSRCKSDDFSLLDC